MKEVADELGLALEIDLWMDETPVPMDKDVVDIVEQAAKTKEMKYKVMHSGAGHDSQVIAPHYPSAMIFVPSIKGISHNPAEATDLADLTAGVEVLAQALYELAYKE